MQTDFFSQQIATVATTTTKMFLKLWTSVTLIFFFPMIIGKPLFQHLPN